MKQLEQQSFPNLNRAIRTALKRWHTLDGDQESPLSNLYLFRKACRDGYKPMHRATNQVMLEALQLLQRTHEPEAKLLQMRFLDLWSVHRLANHFNVAESTFYTMQRDAIEQLTTLLSDREVSAYSQQKEILVRRLEAPTYVNLIGIENYVEHLITCIRITEPPWLISIEGLGGIGKTSLADAILRRSISEGLYDELVWVSVRQNRLNLGGAITIVEQPALTTEALIETLAHQLLLEANTTNQDRSGGDTLIKLRMHLKQTPCLIVIDNLETFLDIESLLPTLQDLANPSKFLLTSRYGLYNVPNIYHFKISELNKTSAIELVRQEAELSNLPVLATCSDEVLSCIYEVVGGNPLALRLVVGQNHFYTLESILHELRIAQGQTVENLFSFIYRCAWENLDPLSRDVLLIMPLVNPYGDELEIIAEIGEIEIGMVRMAMNRLVTYNLVDARGGINDRRYSIHGLTRTFLHEQAIQWQQ